MLLFQTETSVIITCVRATGSAKIHLRVFTISKIFRGLYPRTPVAGEATPPAPTPARLCRARGRFAPPAPQTHI
jgi:hypothetical protein